jgi:GTP cyclohydrolase II
MAEIILGHFGIDKIRLLTNNPKKISALKGVTIVERWPIIMPSNNHNAHYLSTKTQKMGHML